MTRTFLFFLLASILFSCQEEVNLPLATLDDELPVIEAVWTDQNFYNEVKVSLAQNYFDSTERNEITDAEVFILELNTRELIPFFYFGETKSYRPVNGFDLAKVGFEYELHVIWEENEFVANATMLEPPTLDSLTFEYEEERLFRDEGYYIKAYGRIPFEEDNYYRIRVIENDTLKNNREDYLLFDDTFGLSFFEEGLELGYDFQLNDRVRLELFRLNQDAFDYFNQLVGLLFTDGGLFSPPPQNPETNIRVVSGDSEVLGYFMVAPVLTETIVIRE